MIKCTLYFHIYCKSRCFWRNLHRWQKFYTAAGSDGIDKFHLCLQLVIYSCCIVACSPFSFVFNIYLYLLSCVFAMILLPSNRQYLLVQASCRSPYTGTTPPQRSSAQNCQVGSLSGQKISCLLCIFTFLSLSLSIIFCLLSTELGAELPSGELVRAKIGTWEKVEANVHEKCSLGKSFVFFW